MCRLTRPRIFVIPKWDYSFRWCESIKVMALPLMQWNGDATPICLCTCMGRTDRQMLHFHVHSIWKVDWGKKITNHHHIYYKYNLHACLSRDKNIALLPCSAFIVFLLPFSVIYPNHIPNVPVWFLSLYDSTSKKRCSMTNADKTTTTPTTAEVTVAAAAAAAVHRNQWAIKLMVIQ